jgi:aminobenzoyl-glutamate utilization protein B
MHRIRIILAAFAVLLALPSSSPAQTSSQTLLDEVDAEVQAMAKLAQVMVDKIYSFSELGFHEIETSNYITGILEENGFTVERGASGMPTAWFARWGSGSPVISFGSDIDGIPKSSQKPGVAYHDPVVEGAPGHGEGHNSGQAVNVVAALALKKVMEREGIQGTLVLWPGVAEELVGSKAWFVRDGYFEGVDAALFTHVSSNMSVTWGQANGTGLVSAEFTFLGESAHSAGSPWRARSAADAVELMNVGWNYRREHLEPNQRSHSVITDGGDQPNVVPPRASIWYYFREMDFEGIRRNFEIGKKMAEGAALMTDTEMSYRILGTAAPRHFNKAIAEAMNRHIQEVGLPEWSEDDQLLAKAVQMEVGGDPEGLETELSEFSGPPEVRRSGGSDDIGDISWVVPTVTLRFPSNMPGLPGHNWSNGIAMATPIAHKGAVAGARVMARTALQMFTEPDLVDDAWAYFNDVQTSEQQYEPMIGPDDPPAVDKNTEIMRLYKPLLEPFYYDETRYGSYLEQLGITYPTLRPDQIQAIREAESGGG